MKQMYNFTLYKECERLRILRYKFFTADKFKVSFIKK